MEIEYEKETNGIWYAVVTLLDADLDDISLIMHLDGAGDYEIHVDTIDLSYITFDALLLKSFNAFVAKAWAELQRLEEQDEELV